MNANETRLAKTCAVDTCIPFTCGRVHWGAFVSMSVCVCVCVCGYVCGGGAALLGWLEMTRWVGKQDFYFFLFFC